MVTIHEAWQQKFEHKLLLFGNTLSTTEIAVILLHGRNETALSMISLAEKLYSDGVAFIIPQANERSWYPHRFTQPHHINQPRLSQSTHFIEKLRKWLERHGVTADRMCIGGFSQGACLTLEYARCFPRRYCGLFAFNGVLPSLPRGYQPVGSFNKTKLLISCGEKDSFVPEKRVRESAEFFRILGCDVDLSLYPSSEHRIFDDAIDKAAYFIRTALLQLSG